MFLQHYLRNQEIFFAVLLSLIQYHRQSKIDELVDPIPVEHVPSLKVFMESIGILMHVLNLPILTLRAEMIFLRILMACDSLICLDLIFNI